MKRTKTKINLIVNAYGVRVLSSDAKEIVYLCWLFYCYQLCDYGKHLIQATFYRGVDKGLYGLNIKSDRKTDFVPLTTSEPSCSKQS